MKIFRKTRLGLLKDRNTGAYIKYALGEILLVVIGILIALQINNWNQAQKDREILREYLVKIKSHTQEDVRKLDSIRLFRTSVAGQCKKARALILDKSADQNLYILMACNVAFADYYFKPNTGGVDALKNSEYFGRINNTALDSLLTRYQVLLAEIAQNEKSYNDYVVGQTAYLSSHYDRTLILASGFLPPDSLNARATPQSEYLKAFREYTESVPYRNVISLAAWQFDTMIDQYDELEKIGREVIAEIDAMTSG